MDFNCGNGVFVRRFIGRDCEGDMVVLVQSERRKFLFRIMLTEDQQNKANN